MANHKKAISLLIAAGVLFSNALCLEAVATGKELVENLAQEISVPPKLENEILESIIKIYGEENSQEIFKQVLNLANSAIKERSEELKTLDKTRKNDWYKE